MSNRWAIVAVLASVLLLSIPTGAATGGYDLAVSDSVDFSERTITVEGETFHVSSASTIRPGTKIEASVTAPSSSSDYGVLLYDSNRRIEEQTGDLTGNEAVQYRTSGLSPGSYVLAIDDGGFQAVYPVVIQGYKVSVSSPTSIWAGESVEVTVELSPLKDNPAVEAVEIALANGDGAVVEETATEDGTRRYVATFTAPDQTGEYRLGAVVRGPDQVHDSDQHEIIAVSDPTTVTVESSDGTGQGSDSSGPSSPSEGPADTQAPDEPANSTETPTDTADPTDTNESTPTPIRPGTTTPAPTATAAGSNSGTPITPAEQNATADEAPEERGVLGGDGPGPGAPAAIVALLGTAELVRRRRR